MTFIFRADASVVDGVGHVVRCAAVAEALQDLGFESILVGEINGIPWLDESLSSGPFVRIESVDQVNRPHQEDVLIIDSYKLDSDSEFLNQKKWKLVVAFVDRSTPKYHADIYINLSAHPDWVASEQDQKSEIVGGLRYIPVRKIHQRISESLGIDGGLSISVTGGGSDPRNFVQEIGKILSSINGDFTAKLFTSESIPLDKRLSRVDIGPELSKVLDESHLVFTAAGSTVWEILSRRVPMGIACAVSNQRENYEFLDKSNLAQGIGSYEDGIGWNLDKKKIIDLIKKSEIRGNLVIEMSKANIAGGALNIARKIVEKVTASPSRDR